MHEAEFRNKSQLQFLQTNFMQISFCRVQVQTNITPEHSAHPVFGFFFSLYKCVLNIYPSVISKVIKCYQNIKKKT